MDLALTFSGLMVAFVVCAAWATRPPTLPSPREEEPKALAGAIYDP